MSIDDRIHGGDCATMLEVMPYPGRPADFALVRYVSAVTYLVLVVLVLRGIVTYKYTALRPCFNLHFPAKSVGSRYSFGIRHSA